MALSSLQPLRSRNFALVWSAALVSNVGSWMQTVALGIVVTAQTHQAMWTGFVAAAAFVPMGLLAPIGGALADRLDHRRWLIATTIGEAGFAALLAALSGAGLASPGSMVAVALLGGASSAIGFPTYQAMLPDLVERQHLLAAVSLSSAQFNVGRVVGPALAGVVVVVSSATWAFAANAASFGAVVVALLLVRLPSRSAQPASESMLRRIAVGARAAVDEPGCRSAITLIAIVALVGSPFIALVPALSALGLHRGPGGTAVLVTSQGLGAVAGALALAPLARALGRRRLVVRALVAFPLALVVYGLAPSLYPAAFAIFVVGATYIGVLSGLSTVVQLRAPQAERGRVLSLYMMALGTIYPLGALIEGTIANAVGIRVVTSLSGVLLVAIVLALVIGRRPLVDSLDDPTGAEPGESGSEGGQVTRQGPAVDAI